jgi:hypothetical protein
MRLTTADGLSLDARWDGPAAPVTVLCHPHPLFGGSMNAPFLGGITTALVEAGVGVLRFDFRGTGSSGGSHTGGVGEVDDVAAAMVAVGAGPVLLAGWSFGASMAARWAAREASAVPLCLIAPALEWAPEPATLRPARRLVIVGTRDQVVPLDEARRWSAQAGADVVEMETDHFFLLKAVGVARTILNWWDSIARTTEP